MPWPSQTAALYQRLLAFSPLALKKVLLFDATTSPLERAPPVWDTPNRQGGWRKVAEDAGFQVVSYRIHDLYSLFPKDEMQAMTSKGAHVAPFRAFVECNAGEHPAIIYTMDIRVHSHQPWDVALDDVEAQELLLNYPAVVSLHDGLAFLRFDTAIPIPPETFIDRCIPTAEHLFPQFVTASPDLDDIEVRSAAELLLSTVRESQLVIPPPGKASEDRSVGIKCSVTVAFPKVPKGQFLRSPTPAERQQHMSAVLMPLGPQWRARLRWAEREPEKMGFPRSATHIDAFALVDESLDPLTPADRHAFELLGVLPLTTSVALLMGHGVSPQMMFPYSGIWNDGARMSVLLFAILNAYPFVWTIEADAALGVSSYHRFFKAMSGSHADLLGQTYDALPW
eukprot:104535_1